MRLLVRKIVYFPIDIFESFSNKNKNIPKKGDIFIGSGDFISQGLQQLDLLKTYANLKPENRVLDVGSGIGRTAFALKDFLNKTALYEGFDVVEKGVLWCKNNISNNFTNFNFNYTPLNNDLYFLTDKKAEKFNFPYLDNSFDTVFLFSVFTHMQPLEVQNYLKEINRVLKPSGKCLATFFVYNNENEIQISTNNNGFNFQFLKDNYRLMNEKVPSANIAFNEKKLNQMIENAGLKITNQIDGFWKSNLKVNYLQDYQDVLILEKTTIYISN
jgi:ubiquinone/menaquinone biosynthesis C-methylase UbiE